MELEPENQLWREEAEILITRWEQETDSIKEQNLNPDECCKISDSFHHDSDGLLVRKPVDFSDDDIIARLDRLENNLNANLAIACSCSKVTMIHE